MKSRITGGILLVVGTSIGGGMLALPVAAARMPFWSSSLLLIFCWVLMTFSALLILEVNLWFPNRNNMITMALATLGKPGAFIAWLSYLLLLYALLCAYISGGTAIVQQLLVAIGFTSPLWVASILFVIVFGFIVYKGIQPVDYLNRGLMITKLGALFAIIFFTLPYLHLHQLQVGQMTWLVLGGTITIMITSFGFATIVPSLRSYFDGNIQQLRFTIIVGSLIPLICYLLWNFAILGTLPRTGSQGLLPMLEGGGSGTELTQSLSYYLHNTSITAFAHLFTSICVLTAFLSVSLGLSDFLADGLKVPKKGHANWIVFGATFLPPLLIILFYPSIFVKALGYAGICCIVLLVLLPALMAWSGRYHKNFVSHYQVTGGRLSLLLLIIATLIVIVCAAWY